MDKEQVIEDMKNCYQTEGQTIWQHGLSVQECSLSLLRHLQGKIITEL